MTILKMNNIKDKKILGVIVARAGTKRLPGKNVLPLRGKPLIGWTIEAALKSRYITDVVVSTEDKKISEIAKKFGASVPFLRPKELSADHIHPAEVVRHALLFCQNQRVEEYDYVILLQPTSPLRDDQDIDRAIEFIDSKNADAVISVCQAEHSPLWYNTLPEDLSMKNFLREELKAKMSQSLPQYYRLNGAIYICRVERFLEQKTFFLQENIFAFPMDMRKSIDIDSLIDFKLAEALLS